MSNPTPIRVGEIVVEPILDGIGLLSTSDWLGSDWTDHQHLLDAAGFVPVPVGAFLVRIGDKKLLLDAGVGVVIDEMFTAGALLDNLALAGVTPEEIDVVMVSHLHADHMGWLERDGGATFSNATIRVAAAEWEYFAENPGGGRRRAARLKAVADHVELIDTDGTTILPGVTTRLTPGHTPGHTSTVISSGTERLIVLGDAMHCPAQLTETEWQFFYDVDGALAAETRRGLVREAEVPGTALLPCHFPGMQAARLVEATGTRRWVVG